MQYTIKTKMSDNNNDKSNSTLNALYEISASRSTSSNTTTPATTATTSTSRFKSEWNLSIFSLTDTNGKTIDFKNTFAPKPKLLPYGYCIIKCLILIWMITFLYVDIDTNFDPSAPTKLFWLAYLTHWGIITMFLCNILNIFQFFRFFKRNHDDANYETDNENQQEQQRQEQQQYMDCMTRLTWIVSTVTINISLLIVILYWVLDYKGQPVTYLNMMKHGIFALLSTIDVLVINRLPIRLKQIAFVFMFQASYFIWSIVHSICGIGTPFSDESVDTDDDSIYSVLNWNARPIFAFIIVVGTMVVATPVLYLFLWFVSQCFKPRYLC